MEEKNCVVCGALFPLTQKTRLTCSRKCTDKKNKNIRLEKDKFARKSLESVPLYSRVQFAEAKTHLLMYDTPELQKGREHLIAKARIIIEYWNKKNELEQHVFKLRDYSRKTTAKWQRKKKNEQAGNNGDT